MSASKYTCPLPRAKALDAYFLEHRAKLIDLAAFLDRLDRADPQGAAEDFRLAALRQALAILSDGRGERARRVLECFSDPTAEPIPKAPMKGALGAWDGKAAKP
ncbi:MAG: hypothetical protein M5U26_18700 [Planctomycetota bacterium]|nr:hypothetical protein [Planctomycetota bacterium]